MGIRLYVLLLVVSVAMLGVLILLGPAVGNVFTNFTSVTCIYEIKVSAFEDINKNGMQDAGEGGIAGVKVSLQHTKPISIKTPEQTMTDAKGMASLNRDDYCQEHDTFTLKAEPPSGYGATTPILFGPYLVPNYTVAGMTQVAQQPIPTAFYIGLQKN